MYVNNKRELVKLLLLLTFFFVVGCEKGPQLGTVTGTVTYEGKPLNQATVYFTHESGRAAYARTDESGHYELQFSDGRSGALLGNNAVSIETFRIGADDTGKMVEFPEILPEKYNKASEMTRSIEAGDQVIDFELTKD